MTRTKVILLFSMVLSIVESLIFLIVNRSLYANVIDMTSTVTVPLLCLFYGVYGFVKGKRFNRYVAVNVILIGISAVLFAMSIPHVTYAQGEAVVAGQLANESIRFIQPKARTVLLGKRYDVLLRPDFYYYHVQITKSGKNLYYTVNPMTRAASRLQGSFYGS